MGSNIPGRIDRDADGGNGDGSLNGGDFTHDPAWRILRIMAEFVDGFTFLARIQKSVTIFGSARLPDDHPYYQKARELGAGWPRLATPSSPAAGRASCRRPTRARTRPTATPSA